MAHQMESNDWMFSGNGIRPWHGIGTVVEGCPTSDEAIKLAKLDWDVIQQPVYMADGTQIPDWFANIRSDDKSPLGLVRTRYNVVQNKEAFSFVDEIIQNTQGVDCHYETAGSLFGGKRTYLLVRLPDQDLAGDKAESYMFFMNSHDGQSGIIAGVSSVRVVCNNTLQCAIGEAGKAQRIWNIRHTKNLEDKKQQAIQSLKLAVSYENAIGNMAWEMAAKKVNEEEFFKKLYQAWNPTASDNSKVKLYTTIHDIYQNKDDLQNFKGSAWGLLNACADYWSNRDTRTSADNKMLQFCTGSEFMNKAEDIIFEIAA